MTEFIFENTVNGKIDKHVSKEILKALIDANKKKNHDIAIIGVSGRLPKASSVHEFWNNIRQGIDCIGPLPAERREDGDAFRKHFKFDDSIEYPEYGYLRDIDLFDPVFFKISPNEAALMDPSQRLFLETAYASLEDAGYGGDALKGTKTGVYVGYSNWPIYGQYIMQTNPDLAVSAFAGNIPSIIASRISYYLNLKGPSMLIDTACSSSLVAVHEACQSIRRGECDAAIAGGVTINLLPRLREGVGIDSKDYRTRSFDDNSDGTGWGEGVASIFLKPLDKAIVDGDHIYAVIKGSAVNQDGNTIGITAPNLMSQTEVLLQAWKDADIAPETITYIEAHGTGTKLGDPIEIEALTRAFSNYTSKKQFCALGSVKTNIGHLDNTSGIAGVLKAIFSLKNKEIPPILHFEKPNQNIQFDETPFFVNTRLSSWETNGSPRRCGVSSFGLSGTNCHIVLEEAPNVDLNRKTHQNPFIFTVSAKTLTSLKNIIEQYALYFDKLNRSELAIEDWCYTVNTGRYHHQYRLAFVVETLEELKNIINNTHGNGFYPVPKGVYFGEVNIHAVTKETVSEEYRKLFEEGNLEDRQTLEQICMLYVQGATVDWNGLFQPKFNYRKVSLPYYQFDKIRCWVPYNPKINILQQDKSNRITGGDYLLHNQLADSYEKVIYQSFFSPKDQWVLDEHRIFGKATAPGTTWLEMGYQAGKKNLASEALEFENITFHNPLVVADDECVEVHTLYQKNKDAHLFRIASRVGGKWSLHAEGTVKKLHQSELARVPIQKLKEELKKQEFIREQSGSSNDILFGPRWMQTSISEAYRGQKELLVELNLSDEHRKDLEDFALHPALMDLATTLGGALYEGLLIPIGYKHVRIYCRTPVNCYSYIRIISGTSEQTETIAFDIVITDREGKICCEFDHLVLKRVRSTNVALNELMLEPIQTYYTSEWIPREAEIEVNGIESNNIAIFLDEWGLGEQFADKMQQNGQRVIIIDIGDEYCNHSNDRYTISSRQEDYNQLIADLKEKQVSCLIHLATLKSEKNIGHIQDSNRLNEKGLFSLFYLAKSLAHNQVSDLMKIIILTEQVYEVSGREQYLLPYHSSMIGLGKVIPMELSNVIIKCIDVDRYFDVQDLLSEIGNSQPQYQVAYREGKSYVQQLKAGKIKEMHRDKIVLKNEGVYVITGGIGGLGLTIAKYLAIKQKINLALVGRTPVPPRALWNNILDKGEDQKTIDIVKKMIQLEKKGCNVACYAADVTDEEEMKKLFLELQATFGKVNGVIHCAGVSGNGRLVQQDISELKRTVSAKIEGALILDRIVGANCDFFIMFSSINSIFGMIGQSFYTAANSFLDAFSFARKRAGKPAVTMSWPAWNEIGMAVDNNVNMEAGVFKSVTTTQALYAFEHALASQESHLIIGEINPESPYLAHLDTHTWLLPPELLKATRAHQREAFNDIKKDGNEKEIIGIDEQELTDREIEIATIWCEELGLQRVSIFDNYYDLGGDSIQAIKIVNRMNQIYQRKVDISDIFNHLTIQALAAFLDKE